MKTNKFSKRIEQSLAYYASMIFFHLVKLIPVSQIQKVGNIFGSIAYGFIGGSRRKIALCNMAIAFTDRFTEIERAKIFKESVKSFGRMIA
ncbi:MAG: hypothetical protein SVW57_01740, partial [Thermodesulfobacteriota bacterium]|nr:hypothetical protein [Thermodesulfobacteriota bacterium]